MARFWLEEKKGSIVPKTAPNVKLRKTSGLYNSAYNVDQNFSLLKVNGIRQRHIDQGQSFNLYITNRFYYETNNEFIYKMHVNVE